MNMPEPTSTGLSGAALIAIVTSLVGQQLGPFITIAAAALVGTLVSLGEVKTTSRTDALRYMLVYVLMAVVLTHAISFFIEHFTGWPASALLAIVAFIIGWVGNRWDGVRTALVEGVSAIIKWKSEAKDQGDKQ